MDSITRSFQHDSVSLWHRARPLLFCFVLFFILQKGSKNISQVSLEGFLGALKTESREHARRSYLIDSFGQEALAYLNNPAVLKLGQAAREPHLSSQTSHRGDHSAGYRPLSSLSRPLAYFRKPTSPPVILF